MRRAYILLLIFLLGFGCIEDNFYPSDRAEQLASNFSQDLDGDGIADYSIYSFQPISDTSTGMKIERHLSVTTYTTAQYISVNPNLTDVDLLLADQSLDEYSKSRSQSDSACSKNIGLMQVVCSDINTCSRLCSSASVKCKQIAAVYQDVLAGSMISYVQDNNEMRSLILDSRRMVLDLREATSEERNAYLDKTRDMVARIASVNANPIYSHSKFDLCDSSDYGVQYVVEAAEKIGPYSTAPESYHYRIVFTVSPMEEKNGDDLSFQNLGVGLTDRIPRTVVPQAAVISSIQDIDAADEAAYVVVDWDSSRPSSEGYMMEYEFVSNVPPETLVPSLQKPDISIRNVNLSGLAFTNMMLLLVNDITGNYYLALGASIGITIALLLLLYNLIVLAITMLGERAAGATFTTGFRKAFGRTAVKWKTDAVFAVFFIGAGFVASTYMTDQPSTVPSLLGAIDVLREWGIVGGGATLIGVIFAYFAVENLAKIIILERAYGMVIKQEKDMYLAKAATLKEKMKELEVLIEKFTQEDFEVSKEYDVLTTVKGQDIDKISDKITAKTKTVIDDNLSAVDGAINKLRQRKKLADENWPKWRDNISKILEEQNEVFASSLVTVPASLRAWALNRYFKEIGGEGVVLEHDGLKKRKLSADRIVHEMILKGLLKAAIVIKNDTIATSEFAEGSGTVAKALGLKLRTYMRSLAKKLGQHEPQSFVSIGSKNVLVYMKGRTSESIIFVKKDRFNEAIDMWKSKMKILESG